MKFFQYGGACSGPIAHPSGRACIYRYEEKYAKNEYLITIFKGMQNVSLSQLYGHGYSVTYITHENMDCFKHCDSFWAVN